MKCFKVLLKRGARVDAVDSRGETPFYLALRSERESTAKIILNVGGADPNIREQIQNGCELW